MTFVDGVEAVKRLRLVAPLCAFETLKRTLLLESRPRNARVTAPCLGRHSLAQGYETAETADSLFRASLPPFLCKFVVERGIIRIPGRG